MVRATLFTLGVATLLLASSCSSGSNDTLTQAKGKTKVTPGGQVFESDGVSLSMPKDWKVIDFTREQFGDISKNLEADPNLKELVPTLKAAANNKQFRLFAYAPEWVVPGFSGNSNLLIIDLPAGATPEQVFKANKDELDKLVGKSLTPKDVTVTGAVAKRIDWSYVAKGIPLSIVSIVAVRGTKQVVMTFSVPESLIGKANPQIDSVLSTLELK